MNRRVIFLLAGLSGVLNCLPAPAAAPVQAAAATFAKLSVRFEPNQGQWDGRVRFAARGASYNLLLAGDETVLQVAGRDQRRAAVRMRWVGASTHAAVDGLDRLASVSNFLIGNDPSRWRRSVPNYSRVEYSGIYPGVDAVYYGREGSLEYDLRLHPGTELSTVRFRVDGADSVVVDASGDLILHLNGGEMRQHRPVVFQEKDGNRCELAARYVLSGANTVGFEVPGYDRRRPLVIDPVLSYSTYLGGSATDTGSAVAVDSAGSAYLTGTTLSMDYPVASGVSGSSAFSYAVVTKLTPDGSSLVYSTYIGGNQSTEGRGIAVDGTSVYLTGMTRAKDFPVQNSMKNSITGSADAWVLKMSLDGSAIAYSVLLGGSDEDAGQAIAVDSGGNAYIAGRTVSNDFPVTNGAQRVYGGNIGDAFAARISPSGQLLYGTYIGGNGNDDALAIAVDSSRNAYIAGYTTSSNFPSAPYQNLGPFLVKIAADGSRFAYSLVFGPGFGRAQAVAVDVSGNAYIAGYSSRGWLTQSGSFQTTYGGGNSDAFAAKINAAGNALLYSTYLGGSGSDAAYAIAVDDAGNAYVAGATDSTDFPTAGALQPGLAGGQDIFLARLNATGSALVNSTFFGGSGADSAYGTALDKEGNVYLTGGSSSLDFPVLNAVQTRNAGGTDMFVLKVAGGGTTSGGCTYSVNTNSFSAPASGGSTSVSVTAPSGCAWSASSAANWASIVSGSSGTGSGSVSIQVAANTTSSPRTALLTIAGVSFTVAQAGASGSGSSGSMVLVPGSASNFTLNAVTARTLFHGAYSYTVNVPANATQLVLDLTAEQSVTLDIYVRYGSDVALNNGQIVADWSSTGTGAAKRVVITPSSSPALQAGTYYVAVLLSTTGVVVNGSVTATVAPGALPGVMGTLGQGEKTGTLSTASSRSIAYSKSYANAYQLDIFAAQNVTLTLNSQNFSPYLIIYDATGNMIGEEGGSQTAQIVTPLKVGSYRVEVSTFIDGATGSYSLTLSTGTLSSLAITREGVTHAATFTNAGVAPGQIVTLFGTNIGPDYPVFLSVAGTKISTAIGGVRVFVFGVPAPMISAISTQVSFVMPYFVDGLDHAQIQVEYNGARSNYVRVPVLQANPGLFMSSAGQAAALNEDLSVNSASNAIAAGKTIVLFGTGEGQTNPNGVDGLVAVTTYPKPQLPVRVQIGGIDAEVAYAGTAPYMVAGVLQLNVKVPPGVTPGSRVPVAVYVGSFKAGGATTIAVK